MNLRGIIIIVLGLLFFSACSNGVSSYKKPKKKKKKCDCPSWTSTEKEDSKFINTYPI